MANTFKFGNGNWAVKDGYALAYNDENNNFKPLPFDFTRASSATRVNKQGLIETVPSGKPRIDFLDNTSGHLLLEPSRTNLITDYTGAGFTAFNGASITANDSVSPDGSTNATLMTTTGGANQLIQQASIGISSGQSYTISGYFRLKSGTLSDPDNGFKGLDGFSGGVVSSIFNASVTSEWQKLSFTTTSTTTSGRVQIKCEDTAEILIWGLQVELGAYETSIIPTSGSTVTRSAETCNDAGNSTVFNDSEGVLFAEIANIDKNNTTESVTWSLSDGTLNNAVSLYYFTTGGVYYDIFNSSGTRSGNVSMTKSEQANFNRIALKYKSGDISLWVNGFEVDTNSGTLTLSGLSELAFDYGSGTLPFRGKIKTLRVYNTALTDTELQQLTS